MRHRRRLAGAVVHRIIHRRHRHRLRRLPGSAVNVRLTATPPARRPPSASPSPSPSAPCSASPCTSTFTAPTWQTAQTVTVSAVDDAVDDGASKTASVTHAAAGGGYGSVTIGSLSFTITDDDTAGATVSAPSRSTVTEASGTTNSATYTVKLNTEPTGTVTVTPTAGAGLEVSPSSLTFTAQTWQTAQTVTVSAVDDAVDDGVSKTASVTHAATGGGYGSVTIGSLSFTITDDDTAGATVSAPSRSTVTEASGTTNSATYTVKLNTEPTGTVTVTPTAGAGLEVSPASLTFTALTWQTAQTVTVSAVDDAVDDGASKTASVTHAATGGGYGSVTIGSLSFTITDDDTAGATVSAPSRSTVTEASGTTNSATYTVKLNTEPTGTVTVTPTAGAGLGVSPSSLTFTALTWQTAQTVTVSAVDDAVDDGASKTASVTHAATGGGYGSVTIGSLSFTITDDDTAGATVSVSELTVAEGGSDTYTVKLNTQPTGNVTVTVSGAAKGVTVAGSPLTFTALTWQTAQTVTVSAAADDNAVDEEVTLQHGASGGDYGSVAIADVVVTAGDDDTAGVTVSVNALTVVEGASGEYTVKLNTEPSGGNVVVTVSGAANGVSVTGSPLTFTASDWQTAQTVTVSAAEDNNAVDEQVTLTHRASGGDYGSVNIGEVVVTADDNDTAGVTVSVSELTVAEGASVTYTVQLDTEPSGDVTVTVSGAANGVSVTGSPLTFTASDWQTAQTVTVSAAKDENTADEQVTLTHRVSGGGYDSVTVDSIVVRITDTTMAEEMERANQIQSKLTPVVAAQMMAQTLSVVADRVAGVTAGGGSGPRLNFSFGASSETPPPSWETVQWSKGQSRPTTSEMMDGASFNLRLDDFGDREGAASVWGQSDYFSLSGSDANLSWDGGMWAVHFGAELRLREDLLAGAAVSRFDGKFDTKVDGMDSVYETKLTAVQPYLAWLFEDGSNVWTSLSYGSGNIRVHEENSVLTSDLSQTSVAVGARGVLREYPDLIAGGDTQLALRGEGSYAQQRTSADGGLAALSLSSSRMRLFLEGSYERDLADDQTLTTALEAGMRYDDGDVGRGAGLELGARLTWQIPASRLRAELRARHLIKHERDRDEWGVSGEIKLDSKANGSGSALSLTYSQGQPSSTLSQLFDHNVQQTTGSGSGDDRGQLGAEFSYGLAVSGPGPSALLTPYSGVSLLGSGKETMNIGVRYKLSDELSLDFGAQTKPGADALNSIKLTGEIRW